MAEHLITIQNFKFNPPDGEPVVIAIGDTVRWVNRDPTRHDARRDDAPTFRTKLLARDETSDPIEFTSATGADGIEYFCTPHSGFMRGKIIVTMPGSDHAGYSRQEALRAHGSHSDEK